MSVVNIVKLSSKNLLKYGYTGINLPIVWQYKIPFSINVIASYFNVSQPVCRYSSLSKNHFEKETIFQEHLTKYNLLKVHKRFKSKKNNKRFVIEYESSDDESDDENSDFILETGKKFRDMKVNVVSLRMDAILKAGLGMSRSKIEEQFYGNKIKINKEKVPKKSVFLREGDTIDVVKAMTESNVLKTEVARIIFRKIINIGDAKEKVQIILRKYPKIIFDDYKKDIESE